MSRGTTRLGAPGSQVRPPHLPERDEEPGKDGAEDQREVEDGVRVRLRNRSKSIDAEVGGSNGYCDGETSDHNVSVGLDSLGPRQRGVKRAGKLFRQPLALLPAPLWVIRRPS